MGNTDRYEQLGMQPLQLDNGDVAMVNMILCKWCKTLFNTDEGTKKHEPTCDNLKE